MNKQELEVKFLAWATTKAELDFHKEKEMELRKEIVSEVVKKQKGSKKFYINNYEVKAEKKTSISIDDKDFLMDVYDGLPGEIKECFPLSPSFVKTPYNKLDDSKKKIVDGYLVEKPASPTLTYKRIAKE